MTTEHPITPSPVLIDKWRQEYTTNYSLARQAARWGADQELEACVEWLIEQGWFGSSNSGALCGLRAARRPKPPSLAEQALMALDEMNKPLGVVTGHRCDTIHRALERLKELEKGNE